MSAMRSGWIHWSAMTASIAACPFGTTAMGVSGSPRKTSLSRSSTPAIAAAGKASPAGRFPDSGIEITGCAMHDCATANRLAFHDPFPLRWPSGSGQRRATDRFSLDSNRNCWGRDMIPQDRFVIVASVASGNVAGLRERLAQMNFPGRAGFADPDNHLVPFGEFDTIHFARFVVLADNTLGDREAYRKSGYPDLPEDEPTYLCFMVDCDGDADELLQHMVQKAGAGLQEIFQYCGYSERDANLLGWLRAHRVKPRASYVNWVGRTVAQVRGEAKLHNLLRDALA